MGSRLLLRGIHRSRHLFCTSEPFHRRNFMSEAFHCKSAWESRLSSPLIAKLDVDKFFYEVERKFSNEKRGSAIDVDLFAAAAQGDVQMDQLEELLHQFRRTPQTILTMPSTAHSVVRGCLAEGRTDSLMRMLDDLLNYGLFPDDYALVLMLDHFLEAKNWRDACKTAIYLMLQEDYHVPIASEMALMGAYQFGLHDTPQPWEPQGTPPEPEPEDDVKVHVEYLDSGYNDEHFDLVEKNHLVGKTLVKFSSHAADDLDSETKVSVQLLGWSLFEKWEKVQELLNQTESFAQECVDRVKELISANEKCTVKEDLLAKLESVKTSTVDVVARDLKPRVEAAVAVHESDYTERQLALYTEWERAREVEIKRQFEMYKREARREAVARKSRELAEKEERLFFFDRQEEFELLKEERELAWKKKLPPRTWTPRLTLKPRKLVSADYVPPTV